VARLEPPPRRRYHGRMAFPLTSIQTLTTSASPAAVWHAFARVDLWPTAIRSLAAAKLEPEGPLAAGSRIVTRATAESKAADITYDVVGAEPPHHLVLTIDDPAYRATTAYRIVAEGSVTDVVVTATLEAVGLTQTIRFLLWRQRLSPMLATTARERTSALLALAERIGENG
jgi:hypothetical protein